MLKKTRVKLLLNSASYQYNIVYSLLFCAGAFYSGPSFSQQITISGDNYTYSDGCANGTTLNSASKTATCLGGGSSSPTTTPLVDYSASSPIWTQPGYSSSSSPSGTLVGSHGTSMLGNTGATAIGSFEISGGARIDSNLVYIGYEDNTSGQVTVSGPGTHWHTFGTVSVGHYGSGKLTVTDGGVMDITYDPYVYAGYGAGSDGTIIVSGVNGMSRSSILTGNRVYLGYNGDASLSITDGGYFRAMYTSYAGYAANSTTTFNISGVGQLSDGSYVSSLYEVVNNYQNIGSSGKGYANVKDGGSISVQRSLTMGEFAGGLGVLNVDGVNQPSGIRSTVSAGEGLYISEYGTGYLNITNGGLVITNGPAFTNFVDIGAYTNSMGTVNVDGWCSRILHWRIG